jgi:gamma-glutamylcyclotransferase (GGCT)/AIG2-like uncharacterized protein YtfP
MTATRGLVITFALVIAIAASRGFAAPYDDGADRACTPRPDPARVQYVIGYGSLMQAASRERTAAHAGVAEPISVSGYQRGWYARSKGTSLGMTYLGVVPDAASSLNAVMYRIDVAELAATDRRERLYCRVAVAPSAVKLLTPGKNAIAKGQIWIYEIPPGEATAVDEDHPIVQSYVDLFLAGCLELEERFQLRDFSLQCVQTTFGWSAHWINDRLYPRRPFAFQPRALQIDKLLSGEIPAYWSQVRLEAGEPGTRQ